MSDDKKISSILEDSPLEGDSSNVIPPSPQSPVSPPKRKRTGGKPKGWRKNPTTVSQSLPTTVVETVESTVLPVEKPTKDKPVSNFDNKDIIEKIYLFTPKDTIPRDQLKRHLKLCQSMMESLGADELADTDIFEIALIAREQIVVDNIYRIFAESGAAETSMVVQVEKINKAIETRKENLGSRFRDKGQKRKGRENSDMSILDLINEFEEESKEVKLQAELKKKQIAESMATFTSTEEYMEGKQVNQLQLEESEE